MSAPELRLFGVGETHTGLNRCSNEDRFLINNDAQVYAVADGIGGLPMGEKASQCAINVLNRIVTNQSERKTVVTTKSIIQSVNEAVKQISKLTRTPVGIGTTFSLLRMVDGICEIGHVGDSAIFLIRKNSIQKISPTHSKSVPSVSVKNASKDTKRFETRSILSRYIGQNKELNPSVFCVQPQVDDRFMICSDGVSDTLTDQEIISVSKAQQNPIKFTKSIITMVLLRGGFDNTTALTVDVRTAPAQIA